MNKITKTFLTIQENLKATARIFPPKNYSFVFMAGGKEVGFIGSIDGTKPNVRELISNMLINSPEFAEQLMLAVIDHIDENGCGNPDCENCNPEGNSEEFKNFINHLTNNDNE